MGLRGPYSPVLNHTYLIYRKLKGKYHETPWVLYKKEHFRSRVEAEIVGRYLNEWDRQFIGAESTYQVRKFYYREPTRADMKRYPLNKANGMSFHNVPRKKKVEN